MAKYWCYELLQIKYFFKKSLSLFSFLRSATSVLAKINTSFRMSKYIIGVLKFNFGEIDILQLLENITCFPLKD